MRYDNAIVLLCKPTWTDEIFVEGVFDTTIAAEDYVLMLQQDFVRRGMFKMNTLKNGKVYCIELMDGKAWEFEYVLAKHYIGSSEYWGQ